MFSIGDRVVHLDYDYHEYETVAEIHDLGGLGIYLVTNEGEADFAENYRRYNPDLIGGNGV